MKMLRESIGWMRNTDASQYRGAINKETENLKGFFAKVA